MAVRFTAEEVLLMAEQIERNGARFYRFAAERTSDDRTEATLLDLAAWEDRHEQTFAAMRARLSEAEREQTSFDPAGELPLYLRAMADQRIFNLTADFTAALSGRESIQEILEFAVGKEKDSVVFYLGLRDLVPPEVGKHEIEDILREEMTHISILAGRQRALSRS